MINHNSNNQNNNTSKICNRQITPKLTYFQNIANRISKIYMSQSQNVAKLSPENLRAFMLFIKTCIIAL